MYMLVMSHTIVSFATSYNKDYLLIHCYNTKCYMSVQSQSLSYM